ncbi:MAG: DUF2071 domain-containing protein [Myxococcales bacterium]|nr:DUF2071 domain-containing protein [Myxococcales bacterium]
MSERGLVHSQRPPGRPIGFQRWRDLLFLHWRLPAEVVRPLVPPALELDLWDGEAWVGVVPFTMRDVSPWWSPSVPWISNFHELNLRTYVKGPAGSAPGVWFFSLEAARLAAVLIARMGWSLPYFWAAMALGKEGDQVHYRSRRRGFGGPAHFSADYTLGAPLAPPLPGSLEFFLVERYVLYAMGSGGALRRGWVHHIPYPLRAVTLSALDESIRAASGLGSPGAPCHVVASPGVDVDIYPLEMIDAPA